VAKDLDTSIMETKKVPKKPLNCVEKVHVPASMLSALSAIQCHRRGMQYCRNMLSVSLAYSGLDLKLCGTATDSSRREAAEGTLPKSSIEREDQSRKYQKSRPMDTTNIALPRDIHLTSVYPTRLMIPGIWATQTVISRFERGCRRAMDRV
jgi:hypothetical protein